MISNYGCLAAFWTLLALSLLNNPNNLVFATNKADCPCGEIRKRPNHENKALTARWMAHSLDWGVLTTISSRVSGGGVPFGNVYSFVDGSCINATGTPYFYGTYMDQSFQDMEQNPIASFTLTEASLASNCADMETDEFLEKACVIAHSTSAVVIAATTNNPPNSFKDPNFPGDPENPVCARLTMTGTLVEVSEGTQEYDFAQAAFYERHPQMQFWPVDHEWKIAKLVLKDLWLIDYFGGATILTPEEYYDSDPVQPAVVG